MTFYVKIESQKQGTLAGDSLKKGRQEWMTGLGFRYELHMLTDSATGLPTGKRQHSLAFAKAWRKSSPQLFEASMSNEALPTVTFEFVTGKPDDKTGDSEKVFQR